MTEKDNEGNKLFKNAIHLTPKDFEIKNGKVYLTNAKLKGKNGCLMIYANWCGFCIGKDKIINSIANYLRNHNINDYFIAVIDGDNDDMKDVKDALSLEGYPKFFHVVCNINNNNESVVMQFGEEGQKLIKLFSENK